MKPLLIFFCFFASCFSNEPFYYFIPPKDWKVVDPKKLPKIVQIGFLSPGPKPFKASLNLVLETANADLETYVKNVKKHHLISRKSRWSEIGYVDTQSGRAHVSQIDTKAECGDIRTMQCILKHASQFYILTAVALREEFIDYHNDFLEAFESLSIVSSIQDSLNHSHEIKAFNQELTKLLQHFKTTHDSQKKGVSIEQTFNCRKFQKKYWKPFEKTLLSTFKSKGLFWQVMAAKEARKVLFSSSLTTLPETKQAAIR